MDLGEAQREIKELDRRQSDAWAVIDRLMDEFVEIMGGQLSLSKDEVADKVAEMDDARERFGEAQARMIEVLTQWQRQ